jgi:flagellar assembly factor FliW
MGVKFQTTRFGELDLPPDRIIDFPQGIIGFSEVRRFSLVDNPGGGPFQWLQAVDVPNLAFVITDPRIFFPDYRVPVRAEELRPIGIESVDDGAVVVILVVPQDPRGITANLQGPIVINLRDRLARQLVLDVPGYGTRHPIFRDAEEELAIGAGRAEGEQC